MKKIYILLTIIFITTTIQSQSCLQEGIVFNTQEQIDNFQINYPNCSKILGDVTIGSYGEEPSAISNLNGLNSIDVIGGSLEILHTQNLHNLIGLESLDSIGTIPYENVYYGGLRIGRSTDEFQWINYSLSTLEGLNSLSYIGADLMMLGNPILENLDGLESLTSIGGSLFIEAGGWPTPMVSYLKNIDALSNLTSCTDIHLRYLDSLTSLQGLQNIDPVGLNYINIRHNDNLSYCEVASVCSYLLSGGDNNILDNALGCNNVGEVMNACNAVGINEITLFNEVSIYPNPNKGFINIDLGSLTNVAIKVLNVSGQLIYFKEHINSPIYQFELDAASGIYIIELIVGETLTRKKLIIK